MDDRYEYRPFAGLGIGGAAAVSLFVTVGYFFGPQAHHGGLFDLETAAGLGVGFFLFVVVIGRHLFWQLDPQGISWRGLNLRRHRLAWEEISESEIVRGRFGNTLTLRERDGKRRKIAASTRAGRFEPQAVELLRSYGERYGINRGTTLTHVPTAQDALDAQLVEKMQTMSTKEKVTFLKQEAERRRNQQQLFDTDS